MIEEIWLIPLGFVAGVLGSIIGLGGGIIDYKKRVLRVVELIVCYARGDRVYILTLCIRFN